MEILELLVKLEKKLHSSNVRSSREELDILLSDDFREIGASGELYNKKDTINHLLLAEHYDIVATSFELNILSPKVMQLIYKTTTKVNSTKTQNVARNSIWKENCGEWKVVFHQGTVVSEGHPGTSGDRPRFFGFKFPFGVSRGGSDL